MKRRRFISFLLLSSVLLSGAGVFIYSIQNQTHMTGYAVSKGWHFSFPRVFKYARNIKKVKWSIIFDNNCNYVIQEAGKVSVDQKDWNKLCGIFYNIFNTRNETAMIGWRYNIENDEIELAPYYHINSSRDMFAPIMTIKREVPFSVELTIDRKQSKYIWKLNKEGFEAHHEMHFAHQRRLSGFINFYFGGNQAAPQEVSCRMKREIEY